MAVLLAIGALVAAYSVLLQAPAAGTFHDDGIYLITAKALAEDRGYRIISLPAEPSQTKYPVLFPWILSFVWRLHPAFPDNLLTLRLVPLAAMMTWLALSWAVLRRLGARRSEAGVVVLLTTMSPWVSFLSTTLMTETLFAALLAGLLLTLTRIHQGDGRRYEGLAAGFFAGSAVLTRVAGIAPAAIGILVFVRKRQWMPLAQYAGGTAVMTLPWFWWARQQTEIPADNFYSATNYASANIIASYTWLEKLEILGTNLFQVGVSMPQVWGARIPSIVLQIVVAVCALALVGRGLWNGRHETAVPLTLAYCGIHIAWAWPQLRFIVPIAPLLLWFGFIGAGRSRRIGAMTALVLLVAAGTQLFGVVRQARDNGIVWPLTGAEDWHQTARLLAWVSRETPPGAVLTGNHDPMYYLFTGRKAIRAFDVDPVPLYYRIGRTSNPLGTVDDFRRRLVATNADYLIITPTRDFAEVPYLAQLVAELSESRAGSLLPVAGSEDSGYVVYQIDRARLKDRARSGRPSF
jgi:hypothetical protein